MKVKISGLLLFFILTCNNSIAQSSFLEGFLYGLGQAAQNINRQNQYNRNNNTSNSSSDGYIKELETETDGFQWYKLKTKEKYLSSLKKWLTGEPYGAMSKSGNIIVPREFDAIYYIEDDDDGSEGYFIVELDEKNGVYSKRGKCIIPTSRGYTSIYKTISNNKEYFNVEKDDYEGICDANGKVMFSPDKKCTKVYLLNEEDGTEYIKAQKGNYVGIYTINGETIISPDLGYESVYKSKGKDGFVYYKVKKDNYIGILDMEGKEIIPTYRQYTNIFRMDYNEGRVYYDVEKGDFQGICSTDGKELIAPDKYSNVLFYRNPNIGDYYSVQQDGFWGYLKPDGTFLIQPNQYSGLALRETNGTYWFLIVKNGFCGVADATGKVVITPQYTYKGTDEGDWSIEFNETKNRFVYKKKSTNEEKTLGYSLAAFKNKKITAVKESRITSQSNINLANSNNTNNTNSSSESISDGLLYEGIYTISSQGYCAELGGYNQAVGADQRVNIKIYNDYILVDGSRHDYVSSSGNWRIYGGLENFGSTFYYKVNPDNFNMSYYFTSYNNFTGQINTTTHAMAKGETTFNKYSNNNNLYNNDNSSNDNISTDYDQRKKDILNKTVGEDCTYCKGTGKCPACDGTKTAHGFGNSYKCTNCNSNGDCPVCNGTKKTSWNR